MAGSAVALWIDRNSKYEFRLYREDSPDKPLESIVVTRRSFYPLVLITFSVIEVLVLLAVLCVVRPVRMDLLPEGRNRS